MENEETSDAPAPRKRGTKTQSARSGTLKGGHDPRELAARSVAARRARAAERAQQDADAALTFRQRLGISLSRLTQDELDAAVRAMAVEATKGGKPAAMGALARMADQAFGKPAPEEEEDGDGDDISTLTRAQRSALIALLMEEEEGQKRPAGDASDPRTTGDDAPPHPPDPPE